MRKTRVMKLLGPELPTDCVDRYYRQAICACPRLLRSTGALSLNKRRQATRRLTCVYSATGVDQRYGCALLWNSFIAVIQDPRYDMQELPVYRLQMRLRISCTNVVLLAVPWLARGSAGWACSPHMEFLKEM